MLAVALITLAAQQKVVDESAPAAQFYILDGDAIDPNSPSEWKRLAERLPHRTVPPASETRPRSCEKWRLRSNGTSPTRIRMTTRST